MGRAGFRMDAPLRVLIIEDSEEDTLLLLRELQRGGYEVSSRRVDTPAAMKAALDGEAWNVVIADYKMPHFSAPEALKILQESGLDLPFIIVSGQISEDVAVAMMRAGAHDYIAKGSLARLCPAIERELREAAERHQRRRSEAALRESEELYRAVVEQSSECIFLVDARSRRILEVNGAFRELLGYTSGELKQMTLYDFVAHDSASVDERIRLIMENRRHDVGERRYRRKDGTFVDVEVRANALFLSGREVICNVSHDITERKLAGRRGAAQYAVSCILAESSSLSEATPRLLEEIGGNLGWELGALWMVDQGVLRCKEVWHAPSVAADEFEAVSRETSFVPGRSLPGRVWESESPLWIPNVLEYTDFVRLESAAKEGLRGAFAFPIQNQGRVLGVMEFFSHRILPPDENLLRTVGTLGNQIGQFIERKWGEEALKESEERFRATFEQAAVGIAQVALDGRWLRVNQKLCDIVGYSREELLGLTFQDITHPDDIEGDLEQVRRLLAGEIDTYSLEKRYIRKDGSIMWVNLAASAMRESPGEPKYFIAVIEDITERKRAEETRLRMATIVASSEDAIIGKTLDGIITSWNRGAQSIYGYSAEEVVGKPLSILAPPDRPNEIPFILRKVRRGEPIEHYETVRVKKDGTRIDVSITVSPIRDSSGNILGASTIARDITEQKRAEEAIKESRNRLRLAVETTGLGTWDFNPITWELGFDNRSKAMFGLSSEAEMSYEVFLEKVHPEDRERVEQAVRRSLDPASGGRYDIEHRTVGIEGGVERWVAARGQAFFDEVRRAVRFTGTVLDITERKEAEEELRRSEERFRRVVEQAADALFVHDVAGRFVDVNRQACESLGYTREELLSMSVPDVEMDFAPGSLERVWRKVVSGNPLTIRGNHRRKDGTIFPVEIRLGMFESEGRPLILVLARDITERQRAEARLQRSLRALLALYEAGQVLGSTLDPDEILSELLEIVQHVMVPTAAVISKLDENQQLRVWRAVGLEQLPDHTRDTPEVQASLQRTLESGRYQRFRLGPPEEPESLVGICLPLTMQDRCVGVIEVYGSEALLEEDNLEFLGSLVSQAASALENAWLYGELAERERRLHELVGELLMAQEEERRRVAYEVHDSVAQVASAAHQYLQAFVRRFPPVSEKSGKDLEQILKLVRRTVREARRVIAGLRPAVLDDFGLTVALYQEIEELRKSGWQVEYEEECGEERLPKAVEVALFRVAQEALTNARKHAQTRRAHVELKRQKDVVSLEVRDWGQGFDLDTLGGGDGPGKRVGISGMRERVAMLGGEFELRSSPGEGTLVRVWVPLEALTEGEEKGGDER